jgi:serine/threonine-protein kinase
MAPEQARGAPLTSAVDLYALGVVLYEMLVGALPFSGSTPDLILKHIKAAPPAPSAARAEIPRAVDEIVLRLLAKDPRARHKDAHHLLEELRAARAALPGEGEPAPPEGRGFPNDTLVGAPSMMSAVAAEVTAVPSAAAVAAIPAAAEPSAAPAPDARPSAPQLRVNLDVGDPGFWGSRVTLLESLASRAHPRGDVPPWLYESLAALRADTEAMRAAREELERLAARAAEVERRTRETRARIGQALDTLVADESRVRRHLVELETRAAEAKARLDELSRPLLVKWCDLPTVPAGRPAVTREVAEALREAGALASAWLELDRASRASARDLLDRQREHEDLVFQVAQLKGRLSSIDAEAETELGPIRERSQQLDAAIGARLEAVVQRAGPVVQHYGQFPELRAEIVGGGARAAGRAG